jgi:hypothetical protein
MNSKILRAIGVMFLAGTVTTSMQGCAGLEAGSPD